MSEEHEDLFFHCLPYCQLFSDRFPCNNVRAQAVTQWMYMSTHIEVFEGHNRKLLSKRPSFLLMIFHQLNELRNYGMSQTDVFNFIKIII